MTQKPATTQSNWPEAAPIWFAVLSAAQCRAAGNGEPREVRFNLVSGRAVYTNTGAQAERVQPLDVQVESGHTLAVFWVPGETAYSTEVYRQPTLCAA